MITVTARLEYQNVHLGALTHRDLEQWIIEVGTPRDNMDGQSFVICICSIYMADVSYLKVELQFLTKYSALRQFSDLEPID